MWILALILCSLLLFFWRDILLMLILLRINDYFTGGAIVRYEANILSWCAMASLAPEGDRWWNWYPNNLSGIVWDEDIFFPVIIRLSLKPGPKIFKKTLVIAMERMIDAGFTSASISRIDLHDEHREKVFLWPQKTQDIASDVLDRLTKENF